jgi:hypothetical protein
MTFLVPSLVLPLLVIGDRVTGQRLGMQDATARLTGRVSAVLATLVPVELIYRPNFVTTTTFLGHAGKDTILNGSSVIPQAILIHGRAGVGKDTLGRFLHRQHGYIKVAIADILKRYLEDANPALFIWKYDALMPLDVLLHQEGGWETVKREHPEVRELLTGFGQAARNIFGEDFWVEQFVKSLRSLRANFPEMTAVRSFVVTDVRYRNELEYLLDYFGGATRTVKLVRPNHEADGHPSEDGLPDHLFDMVLENNASPGDLFAKMQVTLGIWDIENGFAA